MSDAARTPYTLKEPIQIGTEAITVLQFRKPKAKDFRALPVEGQTVGHILDLVSKLCGQPREVIDEMSAADLEGVSAIVADFTPAGLVTGGKS